MRRSVDLVANEEKTILLPGRVLQMVDLGLASSVTLDVMWRDQADRTSYGAVTRRFKLGPTGDRFIGFVLLSTVNATIDVLVADDAAGMPDTIEVSLDETQWPIQVDTRNANDLAAAVTYPGTVAITDAGQLVLAADTGLRRVVIRNVGASAVGLSRGAAAIAYTSCGIVLAAGDIYTEEKFAGVNLDWRARCDTAGTATVVVETWE